MVPALDDLEEMDDLGNVPNLAAAPVGSGLGNIYGSAEIPSLGSNIKRYASRPSHQDTSGYRLGGN